MTLYAIELGAGPFATGMLFAVYGLIPALCVARAGRIADSLHARAYLVLLGTVLLVMLCAGR